MSTLTESLPARPELPELSAPRMPRKVRRVRRAMSLATTAARGLFSAGKRWGGARSEVRHATRALRDDPGAAAKRSVPALAAGAAGGFALAYYLDPASGSDRRARLRERVGGLIAKAPGRTVATTSEDASPTYVGASASRAESDGATPVTEMPVAGVDA